MASIHLHFFANFYSTLFINMPWHTLPLWGSSFQFHYMNCPRDSIHQDLPLLSRAFSCNKNRGWIGHITHLKQQIPYFGLGKVPSFPLNCLYSIIVHVWVLVLWLNVFEQCDKFFGNWPLEKKVFKSHHYSHYFLIYYVLLESDLA